MGSSSSSWVRTSLAVLIPVFGGFALVSLAGGPDPLGDAFAPIIGALLAAWFISELREDQPRSSRVLLWIGVACGMLVLVGAGVDVVA